MRSVATLVCLALLACGDGPPEERAGVTTFTPEDSGRAVNRVVVLAPSEAVIEAVEDDEVVVAIRADGIERLHGGNLVFTYSDADISLVEVEAGDLLDGGAFATTFGTGKEAAGRLAIGFVVGPYEGIAASGDIARIKLSVRGGASGQVGFLTPAYGQESRDRALVADDGIILAGVRWFGGTATRENL